MRINATSLLGAALLLASAAQADMYDVAADYSRTDNPNGVWSYGSETTLGAPLTLYTDSGVRQGVDTWRGDIASDGNPAVYHNATSGTVYLNGSAQFSPGRFGLHPGPGGEYSVVRWTAPQSGTYALAARFTGLDINGTTTDVHVLLNDLPLFDAVIEGYGAATSLGGDLALAAGDRVDFAVGFGRNGSFNYDSTGLEATFGRAIPEPCGLALLGVGLSGLGVRRWRCRGRRKPAGLSLAVPGVLGRLGLVATLLAIVACDAGPARADMLYVGRTDGTISRIDTATGVDTIFADTNLLLQGLAFDAAGRLYAADGGLDQVVRFSPGGGFGTIASAGFGGPEGLAFDAAGNLYVANIGNNSIQQIMPGGMTIAFGRSGLDDPIGLAFDAAGNLYAANAGDNTIERFTPGGVASVFARTGLSSPTGLAFDAAGNLYVANAGTGTIERFTPGGAASVFADAGLSGPIGLAFDSVGNLYAANQGDSTIERFTPEGGGNLFDTGVGKPRFLAFAPRAVPEPSGLALLGTGVVGLLALGRRRSGKALPPC